MLPTVAPECVVGGASLWWVVVGTRDAGRCQLWTPSPPLKWCRGERRGGGVVEQLPQLHTARREAKNNIGTKFFLGSLGG